MVRQFGKSAGAAAHSRRNHFDRRHCDATARLGSTSANDRLVGRDRSKGSHHLGRSRFGSRHIFDLRNPLAAPHGIAPRNATSPDDEKELFLKKLKRHDFVNLPLKTTTRVLPSRASEMLLSKNRNPLDQRRYIAELIATPQHGDRSRKTAAHVESEITFRVRNLPRAGLLGQMLISFEDLSNTRRANRVTIAN